MNQSQNSPFQTKPKKSFTSHANFIEALKSAGSDIATGTAKSFKQDLIQGTANQVVDSLFGTNQASQSQEQPNEQPFNFAEYLKANEQKTRSQERVKYEYDQSETIVFNRRQQEVEKKIETIRIEIQSLAKEIISLDQATQAAISQEIVNPGTYHLNFFEKLARFLRDMKKRVTEARHWSSMQSQRSQTKSYYWNMANSKKGGTMFSMSQERAVVTQTG